MPFKIALRTDLRVSPFKRYVREIITAAGPSGSKSGLVMCNAYWYPWLIPESHGAAGNLADLIERHCSGGFVGTLASRRAKSKPDDWTRYAQFVYDLKAAVKTVTIIGRTASYAFWHAKIALRIIDDQPIAAVIGSSNMTFPAFSERHDYFNHESDVLIWPNDATLNVHFTQSQVARSEGPPFEVYGTENNGDDPRFPGFQPPPRPSIEEQLDELYKLVRQQIDTGSDVAKAPP
jgi:hypothetical protein